MRNYGLYINGHYVQSPQSFAVQAAVDDPLLHKTRVALLQDPEDPADAELAEAALEGAAESFRQIERGFFPLAERLAFLDRLRTKLSEQSESIARLMCVEVGKPLRLARQEVERGLATIDWTLQAAPEIFAPQGLPTASRLAWQSLTAFTLREGKGPLLAITPFNFPLNLVMHKVAPALAAGCPVILKASPKAAMTALALADLCQAAELPAGLLSVLQCSNDFTLRLLQDPRVAQASFTGSVAVGQQLLHASGGRIALHLELGGNAPVFVDESADVSKAAQKIALGAFSYAGQVCISTQNVSYHPAVEKSFLAALKEEIEKFPWGDPRDEAVLSGPLIDEAKAQSLLKASQELLQRGAQRLAQSRARLGQAAEGPRWMAPAAFTGVPAQSAFAAEELFAPFLNLFPVASFSDWCEEVNRGPYRLQAALFTASLPQAFAAARRLRFGGVLVNESTALRLEPMPYGGRGAAGNTREGPRYALENFTELKSVIMNPF